MLKGKSVIVTGSTSGIGLAIARKFAAAGTKVMLNGLGDAHQIETMRYEMAEEFGVDVAYAPSDMTKPAEIAEMIDLATAQHGAVDILVNNAGIQFTSAVQDFPPEKWDQIIAINLSSVFHGTRLALPQMLERNWGRIINIASAHGLVASAQKAAYVAAKHGVVGLTKVVGLETAKNRRHLQRHLPRLGADALGGAADRGARHAERHDHRGGEREAPDREAALGRVRDGRAGRRPRPLLELGERQPDPRHGALHGWWLDGAIAAPSAGGVRSKLKTPWRAR